MYDIKLFAMLAFANLVNTLLKRHNYLFVNYFIARNQAFLHRYMFDLKLRNFISIRRNNVRYKS